MQFLKLYINPFRRLLLSSIAILCLGIIPVSAQRSKEKKEAVEEVVFDENYLAPKTDSPLVKESIPEKVLFDTIPKKLTEVIQPTESPIKKGKKDRYQIAILMPFGADSLQALYESRVEDLSNVVLTDDEETEIPFSSELSLQFLEGFQLAMEKMKAEGLKADIQIYDFKNPNEFQKLLEDKSLKSSDIIIGPVGSQSGKKLADFCLENKIWQLLPYATSIRNGIANPYLIKLNPDMHQHWCRTVDHFADSNKLLQVIYLHERNASDSLLALSLAEYVQKQNAKRSDSIFFKALVIHDKTIAGSVKDHFRSGYKNLVMVNSYKSWLAESYVKSLSGTKAALVGLPQWIQLEKIDYAYLRELEFYYSEELFLDKGLTEYKELNKPYKLSQRFDLPDRSVQAYDMGIWLSGLLIEHGLDLQNGFGQHFHGICLDLDIEAQYKNGQFLYYENEAVPLLRVIDWQLKKVNQHVQPE